MRLKFERKREFECFLTQPRMRDRSVRYSILMARAPAGAGHTLQLQHLTTAGHEIIIIIDNCHRRGALESGRGSSENVNAPPQLATTDL